MAVARISIFGRTLTVRRHPYFRKEEVRGQVPSLRLGNFRISWWPKTRSEIGKQITER